MRNKWNNCDAMQVNANSTDGEIKEGEGELML